MGDIWSPGETGDICHVFLSASFNPVTCDCGAACEETAYTTQVSYSEFPDDGVSKILKHLFAYNKSVEYQR